MIKLKELMKELSYVGNLGIEELFHFFGKASPSEIQMFQQFVKTGKHDQAMQLVQKVTGVKLKGM